MFVPRLSSLLFGGDVETAVVMAVSKLGYIEPIIEQSEGLEGFVRGNDFLVHLYTGTGKSSCYATRQATSARLSLCKGHLRLYT